MKHDFLFALRLIRSRPWFSLAIVATVALGIGINTTVFTLVNAVLFKPVPIPNSERLVCINGHAPERNDRYINFPYSDFVEIQKQTSSFEFVEGANVYRAVVSDEGNPPELLRAARLSAGALEMLSARPILGAAFQPEHAERGAANVLLISYNLWKNRFSGDPGVVGRSVRVNGYPAEIVGVMPEGFKFPHDEEMWLPLAPTADLEKRPNRWVEVFGLLKEGVSIEDARAELAVIAKRLASEYPDTNEGMTIKPLTFHERYNGGEIRLMFLAMMGAVGFVLLIACANVANMMLSRAISRRYEISLRAAMGASRWQIARQLLAESITLSFLGGLLGLSIAAIGVRAFDQAVQGTGKPYWVIFELDYRVFIYFAAVTIASGLLFGLAPALRASRASGLGASLKDGGRSSTDSQGGRLTAALVVFQFAMTLALLAGAGLMTRSFFAAQGLNAFVPADRIFTARLSLPEQAEDRYAKASDRLLFYQTLLERLEGLPEVTHAASTSALPGMGASRRRIEIDGRPPAIDDEDAPEASLIVHSEAYLQTINLPLREGRRFHSVDDERGQKVAVATRGFVQEHWPAESGLGKRFRFRGDEGEDSWITIVGVAENITQQPRQPDAPPLIYLPHQQKPWGGMAIVLRTRGDPNALAPLARAVVKDLDQDLPLFEAASLRQAIDQNYWYLRVFGSLFLIFAAVGLLMAAVGIYAVVAQATARRTQEIGVRMALGATSSRVLGLVLARGVKQLAIGIALGLALCFATTHLLSGGILFRISPRDPLVFSSVCALLGITGLVACWLPARRAATLHPSDALRDE